MVTVMSVTVESMVTVTVRPLNKLRA